MVYIYKYYENFINLNTLQIKRSFIEVYSQHPLNQVLQILGIHLGTNWLILPFHDLHRQGW